MKKLLPITVVVLLLIIGCNGRVRNFGFSEKEMEEPDTIEVEDFEIMEDEEEIEPQELDESFDDFIYNFATDEKLQLRRVKFPLSVYNQDEPIKIEEENWIHDSLFMNDEAYTVMFDDEEDIFMESDTSTTSIQFEWLYLHDQKVKKYYFERIDGKWMLEALNIRNLGDEDGESKDFIGFYEQFANDSLFQFSRVTDPLTFVTVDPDNEFSIIESFIGAEQWPAFRPSIPTDKLSNISYGQKMSQSSVKKILKVNGVVDGSYYLFYFRKVRGEWKLYKYEDTSV